MSDDQKLTYEERQALCGCLIVIGILAVCVGTIMTIGWAKGLLLLGVGFAALGIWRGR